MAVRLAALLPRAVIVVLVWMLATAAFTLAADKQIIGPTTPKSVPAAPAPPLVVPAVTGQAFVFAKGMLEDAGFAWRVEGPVHGYAANLVVSQSPAAGAKVVNTGAPTIVVHLEKGKYVEKGSPEDTASYTGTRIVLTGAVRHAVKHTPAAVPKPTVAAPKKKPVAAKPKPAVKKKPASAARPPAFTVHGAPKEPLDEISLPARADQLAAWVATNPKATKKNVQHWLYQHAWIVDGAKFGWWHGARALTTLIAVDRTLERNWGIGQRSEAVARAALKRVKREAK